MSHGSSDDDAFAGDECSGDEFPGDAPSPSALALASAANTKISLREQAEEAQRELARRHRSYSGQVKHGSMSPAEKAVGIARQTAIRDTLQLFATYEADLRDFLLGKIAAARAKERAGELEQHPAVTALRNAFPDAELAAVRPLYPHTGDAA